jgi:hypothetical protein
MVRDAFHTWAAAGIPVRFAFVSDSARASIHVVWRHRLSGQRAGQVTRYSDEDGWLRAATVELSTSNMSGRVQDSLTVRAVALHEIGHLLGLEHSPDAADIMAPWVKVRRLSDRDRAAAHALYGGPADHDTGFEVGR